MSQNAFDKWLGGLDFDYWSTAQHKVMPAQLFERLRSGEDIVLLDVRAENEGQFISLPFAQHIPINELPARWLEVPQDKPVVTFCSGGDRAAVAYAYLQHKGLKNVRMFKGGYAELMGELMPGKLRKLLLSKA